MRVLSVLLLVGISGAAFAQDLPVEDEIEVVEVKPTPLFAEGWTWRSSTASPGPRGGISTLGGLGGTTGLVFALDGEGAVWRSEDDGKSWKRTLSGQAVAEEDDDQEQILLEAESLASELLGDTSEIELDPEALDEDILEEIGRIQDQADTLAIQDFIEDSAEASFTVQNYIWVHPNFPDLVLLSRQDGIWRSGDGGRSFSPIDSSMHFNEVAWSSGSLILAATRKGMAYSLNGGRTWMQKSDGTEDLDCKGLSWTGSYWLLATSDGIYRSQSGESWRRVANGLAGKEVEAIALDPSAPGKGSGWAASDSEVFRFEENGNRVLRLSRQDILNVDTLAVTSRPGQVIAAGDGGVWESGDGGFTWRPISVGLKSPEVNGLIPLSEGLILGSPTGLFVLTEGEEVRQEREVPTQPELEPLMSRALARNGMDPRSVGVKTAFSAARRVLPELSLDGQLVHRRMLAADYFDLTNSADNDVDWRVLVSLRWGGSGGSTDPGESETSSLGDLFYVLGGRVYSGDNPEALQTATSRLLVDSTNYRMEVRRRVSDLYFARKRLLQIPPPDPGLDVRAATLHQLDLQELSAWLDVYTDGAFSLALRGD